MPACRGAAWLEYCTVGDFGSKRSSSITGRLAGLWGDTEGPSAKPDAGFFGLGSAVMACNS